MSMMHPPKNRVKIARPSHFDKIKMRITSLGWLGGAWSNLREKESSKRLKTVVSDTRMGSMNKPVEVRAIAPFRIWVRFDDGSRGEVDLGALARKGGVFSPWREPGFFETVHIDEERGTVAWNREIDLCPDSLYLQVTGKKTEEIFSLPKS